MDTYLLLVFNNEMPSVKKETAFKRGNPVFYALAFRDGSGKRFNRSGTRFDRSAMHFEAGGLRFDANGTRFERSWKQVYIYNYECKASRFIKKTLLLKRKRFLH